MGNILKDLRESRGLTIESAADAIGISARTLKRYEKGQFGQYELVKGVADFYHVPVDELTDTQSSPFGDTPEGEKEWRAVLHREQLSTAQKDTEGGPNHENPV